MVEYGAVIVLVAAVFSVVMSAGIGDRVTRLIEDSLESAASGEASESSGGDDPDNGGDEESASGGEPPDAQPETGDETSGDPSGHENEAAPEPEFDTAEDAQGQNPDTEPADNSGGDGTYGFSMAGIGEWGEEFADQTKDRASETWENGKEEAGEFLDSPAGYTGDKLSETGETLAEGWNYMNDRRDELYEQQSEDFSEHWDNGEYASAALGYTGDMFAIPLWKQPFSPGGLVRGTVDSIQDVETQEVRDAREAGEHGKADAMVAWNGLGMFLSPLDRLKVPDVPGGGSNGGSGDTGGSRDEESTSEDEKDEDKNLADCANNSFVPGTPVLTAEAPQCRSRTLGSETKSGPSTRPPARRAHARSPTWSVVPARRHWSTSLSPTPQARSALSPPPTSTPSGSGTR
ncbi:hypothetical protein [Allosalinactinospora lopnorensis]|uniref:hypothetical protein n=1 Tax=Allosalinactinospora lopnorensis TaxID=1352348 RepID=UPI000623D6FF|nr:hypothetical protein [Allosalinactinospora lopnorensis]